MLCTWAGHVCPVARCLTNVAGPLETYEEAVCTLHLVAVYNMLCLALAALAMLLSCNERLIEHDMLSWHGPVC